MVRGTVVEGFLVVEMGFLRNGPSLHREKKGLGGRWKGGGVRAILHSLVLV